MTAIRVVDLGAVAAVRSQTVYHAVAGAMTPDTPNTILLVRPEHPYVCIGYHQDPARDVDLEACTRLGLPVYRRQVGGGAVYLDGNQVFAQWIFHPAALPGSLDDQFSMYIEPLVATYRGLGIEAYHRPVNDVHVGGKKIGGTGAAQIGEARVLVGSLMFDFDRRTMADVLRIPSEKMRDKVFESLSQYMTTIADEVGEVDRGMVTDDYLARCQETLGMELESGHLTGEEERAAERLDWVFQSPDWLYGPAASGRPGVKIHEDVAVHEGAYKAPGGLVRAVVVMHNGVVDDLALSGDFTILPAARLVDLELAARGAAVEAGELARRFAAVFERTGLEAPGLTPDDLATAVVGAATGGGSAG